MKKSVLLFLFSLVSLCSYSQLFNEIFYYDKFDDVIKSEKRKTLVTKTDSTFIIEEKGKEAIVYYILNSMSSGTRGSKDNVVNLINNVYGYEKTWCVIPYKLLSKYNEDYQKYLETDNIEYIKSYWLFIVHRVISRYQFSFYYDTEYFWIQDDLNEDKLGKNVNRIIYEK